MLGEEVAAKISVEVPPDGVDVVGSVLSAVVLVEELGRLDTVIVTLSRTAASGPGKVGFLGIDEWVFARYLGKHFRSMLDGIGLHDFS